MRAIELNATLKSVFNEAGIDYNRGYRIISGFLKPDANFTGRIQAALKRIEQQKQQARAAKA